MEGIRLYSHDWQEMQRLLVQFPVIGRMFSRLSEDHQISLLHTLTMKVFEAIVMVPGLQKKLMGEEKLGKIETKNHIVYFCLNKNFSPGKAVIIYRKIKPFLSDWFKLELSSEIEQLVNRAPNMKEAKRRLSKALGMIEFW